MQIVPVNANLKSEQNYSSNVTSISMNNYFHLDASTVYKYSKIS